MADNFALKWDDTGDKLYETGTDRGVIYHPNEQGEYTDGEVWNGLTAVNETPSGAESNPLYADNIKYVDLRSAEEFGYTIEAFTYPESFAKCDGSAELKPGVYAGQQAREPFGFSYRTKLGNDSKGDAYGYKLHLIYSSIASPSEKGYQTVNDSPEAITFSWECTTTPVNVTGIDKPTAIITIDSTKVPAAFLTALENVLYGTGGDSSATPAVSATPARLPLPDEVATLYEENKGNG